MMEPPCLIVSRRHSSRSLTQCTACVLPNLHFCQASFDLAALSVTNTGSIQNMCETPLVHLKHVASITMMLLFRRAAACLNNIYHTLAKVC